MFLIFPLHESLAAARPLWLYLATNCKLYNKYLVFPARKCLRSSRICRRASMGFLKLYMHINIIYRLRMSSSELYKWVCQPRNGTMCKWRSSFLGIISWGLSGGRASYSFFGELPGQNIARGGLHCAATCEKRDYFKFSSWVSRSLRRLAMSGFSEIALCVSDGSCLRLYRLS